MKKQATFVYPEHGAVYLNIIKLAEGVRRYAGQSDNARHRITENHNSASYRRSHRSYQYFLLDRAEEYHFLLPVQDLSLKPGPILNILEQWISLIFRCLQSADLRGNMAPDSFVLIPRAELEKGVNLREPLAQGFDFKAFPMKRHYFKHACDSLKREYFEASQDEKIFYRRDTFLRGDLFEGHFWLAPGWYQTTDYEFQIWSVKFRVGRSFIDRFEPESIRVLCDFLPEGQTHPNTVIRGMFSPECFNDPAGRLGIKISGIHKADQKEGFVWVQMDGGSEKSIPRVNRLADWLDGLDTEVMRPRRWYPANERLGRLVGVYTPHPLEKNYPWFYQQ